MATEIQRVNDSLRTVAPSTQKHLAAIREAGKADRLNFTDAVKSFIEYVDDEGEGSSRPDLAYSNMTKMVYAAFALNKKQREALENGLKPRDTFDLLELRFLQLAESSAALVLNEGMSLRQTRKAIKAKVRDECGFIASGLRRLQKGVFAQGGQK